VSTRAYSAASVPGRVLLALRAGAMEMCDLVERFGRHNIHSVLRGLVGEGLVEIRGPQKCVFLHLTNAGRAACPSRRAPAKPATRTRRTACPANA
jgi:hypothetical protein